MDIMRSFHATNQSIRVMVALRLAKLRADIKEPMLVVTTWHSNGALHVIELHFGRTP